MLPSPVLSRRYRVHSHPHRSVYRSLLDILLTRCRLTNLGLITISSIAALSLLLNLAHYLDSSSSPNKYFGRNTYQLFDENDNSQHVMREPWAESLDHLIIVPGHAIWKGVDPEKRSQDSEWILKPYQKGTGKIQVFWEHIAVGAEIALGDERSLLVFSGGQTRPESPHTEAQSYLRLAVAAKLLPSTYSSTRLFPRATTEDYALDSYQNLIFSVARFHEVTGRYPSWITVVGYAMKKRRFEELHRRAIRWPEGKLEYIGIDGGQKHVTDQAKHGELTNAYLPYKRDTYGCHSKLASKRIARNPFLRFHPYWASAKELRGLLEWCPDGGSQKPERNSWWNFFGSVNERGNSGRDSDWDSVYPGELPWDP
ncbi:hypothetical protein BJ322DRAFT_1105910 [Thelephora terrestris]|uniref:DUF218 domain-containing protein n=1 Tax=Thelephora terrestris TaxID=56493 RepID=A0A9P6HIW3_9AGAM|nr:hypothetical protein BJ322DRAFT_1105910 [Thelephora terrestris]